jgi:hypothetical protein
VGAVQGVRVQDEGTAGVLEEGQCAFWSAVRFQSIQKMKLRNAIEALSKGRNSRTVFSMRRVSAGFLRIRASLCVSPPKGPNMATIRARNQANGSTRYTAMVRLRKGKTIIHQEAKTFAFRAAAFSWAKHARPG